MKLASSFSGTNGALLSFIVTASVWLCYSFKTYSQEQVQRHEREECEEILRLRYLLKREKALRDEERVGRIAAQRKARIEVVTESERNGYRFRAIAHIESPFPDRRGTPRQPTLVTSSRGCIVFDRTQIQYEHYQELSQFSHVWVLFVFHENTNGDIAVSVDKEIIGSTLKHKGVRSSPAKIAPPRLQGKRVGCLSTRSPHRPNPLGLSVCRVLRVDERGIEISCVDMVDGTPVLDVKPYIPYDIIPSNLPLPMQSSVGEDQYLRVPEWVYEADIPLRSVRFEAAALDSLRAVVSSGGMKMGYSEEEAVQLISQVLRQDIRSLKQGRGTSEGVGSELILYEARIDNLHLKFVTFASEILIQEVGPCY